jgi:hypothetical protein
MTTKTEMIAILKAENPTLQIGDDEQGYTQLTGADYDAQIEAWAEARYLKETKKAEEETAKTALQTKLVALGLTEADLIAMGLMPKPVEPIEPA